MPSASQAARGDETVTERTTCSWAVRRVGCAGRLCSKVGANYGFSCFLLFYIIAKYQLKYCKIVAKIVCSKMLFPGSGRLFSESGVRCTRGCKSGP